MGYCDKYCNVSKHRHSFSHRRCYQHYATNSNLSKIIWLRLYMVVCRRHPSFNKKVNVSQLKDEIINIVLSLYMAKE